MTLVLVLLGVVSVAELMLTRTFAGLIRKPLEVLIVFLLTAASVELVILEPAAWTVMIAFFSLYRIVNVLRFVDARMQAEHLLLACRLSSRLLISAQVIVAALALLGKHARIGSELEWYCLGVVQLLAGIMLFASVNRSLRTTRAPVLRATYADRDLPTLTIAIPARNETDDLQACLESLVASTYPKLEVLVLDDCSQNKHTPAIIRDFAHAGVRFIAGEVPPETWLAKNYAYEQLSREANGQLLLFCGVDVRFEPDSLRTIVETMLYKKKSMVSWLPANVIPRPFNFEGLLIQPRRYAWELALPRRWLNRPPVLSTCWIITTERLRAAGGFRAVSRSISPESYFARAALASDDGYSFLQSSHQIGLTSTKTFLEQRATAVRTRYPQLHRRLELAGGVSLLELLALLAPFVMAVAAWSQRAWPLAILCTLASLLLIAVYAQVVTLTYRRFLWRSLWLLPFVIIYDVALLNYSLWKYEFSEVVWKGRNVCIPMMHIVPALPKVQ